jgi:hypothetical protein
MTEAAWLSELKNCRDGITTTRPSHHNNPALAVLVPDQAAITAMCFDIIKLNLAAIDPACTPSPPMTEPL